MLFHLRFYQAVVLCWQHKQGFTARMPRSREILSKGRREKNNNKKRADVEKYLLAQYRGAICPALLWLLADQPVCPLSLPGLKHTHVHANTQTHTRSTRFTGDKPAGVILAYFSAQSIQYTEALTAHTLTTEQGEENQEGGWRMSRDLR